MAVAHSSPPSLPVLSHCELLLPYRTVVYCELLPPYRTVGYCELLPPYHTVGYCELLPPYRTVSCCGQGAVPEVQVHGGGRMRLDENWGRDELGWAHFTQNTTCDAPTLRSTHTCTHTTQYARMHPHYAVHTHAPTLRSTHMCAHTTQYIRMHPHYAVRTHAPTHAGMCPPHTHHMPTTHTRMLTRMRTHKPQPLPPFHGMCDCRSLSESAHRLLMDSIRRLLAALPGPEPGGYLCRVWEGELKYMLAFHEPQVRGHWGGRGGARGGTVCHPMHLTRPDLTPQCKWLNHPMHLT